MVLDQGRVIFDGDVEQAIAVYMETTDVNVVHYDLLDVSRMNASAGKRMRLENAMENRAMSLVGVISSQ